MQTHSMMSHQMDTRLSLKPQLFTALIFYYAVATLLLTHGGRSQQIGQPQPLVAVVGGDITLPCHVKPAKDAVMVMMMVEWSRPDLQPRFVHMRRSGEDRLVDQNPAYRGRTSVSIDGLEQGDLSLTLSNVKPSDEGTYRCFAPDLDTDSRIQLVVDVIKISKVSTGVLECKYSGQYTDPEMFWLDSEGNHLSAGPTETVRGPDGLYTVSSNLTVEKGHRNNFTCRVQEKSTGQSKETHVYVPDDFFTDSSSSSAPAVIGVFVAIMLILAAVFGVWKWRQNKCKAWSYNTDEEKGGNQKNKFASTESEQKSLMKRETGGEKSAAEREMMMNQKTVEEENNIESSKEETGLSCEEEKETQQTQTTNNEPAGKNPTDEGIRRHDPPAGGQTMNDMDNSKEATKTVSEETQIPDPSDPDSSQDKPEKNRDVSKGKERTKSIKNGTEDQGTMDGEGQEGDKARGQPKRDPEEKENKEKTETPKNESAGKTPTETQTPSDPSDPDSSQDKPEKNTEEGTKSINNGTKGQGTMDGGQENDMVGSEVNTGLNKDGNKEQTQTAGQSPSDGGGQENQPLVKDDKDTPKPLEGTGQQEKKRDDKDGGGDTTPTEHTHNTTSKSPETEVQKDEDRNKTANNKPAAQGSTDERRQGHDFQAGGGTNGDLKRPKVTETKEKDPPAEGGEHKVTTPDTKDGGDSTTCQSPVDEAPDQLEGADGQNDLHKIDGNNKTNPANNKTTGQAVTAGEEQKVKQQTGGGKNSETDDQADVKEDTKPKDHDAGGDPTKDANMGHRLTKNPSETDTKSLSDSVDPKSVMEGNKTDTAASLTGDETSV